METVLVKQRNPFTDTDKIYLDRFFIPIGMRVRILRYKALLYQGSRIIGEIRKVYMRRNNDYLAYEGEKVYGDKNFISLSTFNSDIHVVYKIIYR